MNPNDYRKNADITDHKDYSPVTNRISGNEELVKFTHFALGIGTEAGEIQDILKKALVYGKTIDKTNLKEEIGDLLWYVDRLCKMNNWTLEEVMEMNINKLKVRYGDKFTEEAALNRNLENERKVLENKQE